MAITLGKLTVIVGAGLLGSVLAKDGGPSKVSEIFSGAFKIVFKHLQHEDTSPKTKTQNDSLMAQVNNLRQELQQYANSRAVMVIATKSRSGARTYLMPILVVGFAGYGYIWWKVAAHVWHSCRVVAAQLWDSCGLFKGWKISDLMFATRRSFTDACTTIGKQLDQVSSSLSAAKRHLSSRIDRVDVNLDECTALTAATKDEVSQLRGDLSVFTVDIESVHRAVQCLESKIGRIEEKQDFTNEGVHQLCVFVQRLEETRRAELTQVRETRRAELTQGSSPCSSRPALESPVISSTSRTLSLPSPTVTLGSPSTSGDTPKVSRPLQHTTSGFGLKDLQDLSVSASVVEEAEVPTGVCPPESSPGNTPSTGSSSGSSSRSGWKLPGLNTAFFTRTHNVTYSFR